MYSTTMCNKMEGMICQSNISIEDRMKIRKRKQLAISHYHHQSQNSKRRLISLTALIAMSAKETTMHTNTSIFDTDSKSVGIDNRCSACISHDIRDFIGPLRESNRTIKGFGGIKHTSTIMSGTIKWKWEDDEGRIHKHIIPDSYYVPDGKSRLLSPQHWSKSQKGKLHSTTGEFTNAKHSVLQWGKEGEYTLTVPLTKESNH